MTEREMIECVTMEMLSDASREIAEIVGIEKFRELVFYFSGTSKMYIPCLHTVVMPVRNQCILEDFNKGTAIEKIARTYELSHRQVQLILKEIRQSNRRLTQ